MSTDQARQFVDQALDCIRSERFSNAEEFARQALEIDPSNADAYGALGISLSRQDRGAEAEQALRNALDLNPDGAKQNYNLAAHLYSHGQKRDAMPFLKSALERAPGHAQARDLLRRIEAELGPERLQPIHAPPTPSSQPGTPEPPPAQQPIGPTPPQQPTSSTYVRPPQYYQPGEFAKPKHTIGWVERSGAVWPVALWGSWLLTTIAVGVMHAMFMANESALGSASASNDPNAVIELMFGDAMAVMLAGQFFWLMAVTLWIIDMVDRRPAAGALTLGIIGAILSTPCLCACFTPYVSLILFAIYFKLTRQP